MVLRHISHLPALSHFRDRSPCIACDFVVNGFRKICVRYCILFTAFYDGDKTSGYLFTSFARGDLFSRWRQKKTHDDETLVSSSDDEKKEGFSAESKRKCTGSFQYKVVFKESWKADYPIKAVSNDKYKFHSLPCGRFQFLVTDWSLMLHCLKSHEVQLELTMTTSCSKKIIHCVMSFSLGL